jgi:hypothetical protein
MTCPTEVMPVIVSGLTWRVENVAVATDNFRSQITQEDLEFPCKNAPLLSTSS